MLAETDVLEMAGKKESVRVPLFMFIYYSWMDRNTMAASCE